MSAPPRNPPFRAEHIGSLLRPDELVKKRYAVAEGSAKPEELVPVEQKAIRDIVKVQQDAGIESITNGEYSRHQFWGACAYKLAIDKQLTFSRHFHGNTQRHGRDQFERRRLRSVNLSHVCSRSVVNLQDMSTLANEVQT